MSFHEDMFHETKRERKFYEKRKQVVIRFINSLYKEAESRSLDNPMPLSLYTLDTLKEMVNNI